MLPRCLLENGDRRVEPSQVSGCEPTQQSGGNFWESNIWAAGPTSNQTKETVRTGSQATGSKVVGEFIKVAVVCLKLLRVMKALPCPQVVAIVGVQSLGEREGANSTACTQQRQIPELTLEQQGDLACCGKCCHLCVRVHYSALSPRSKGHTHLSTPPPSKDLIQRLIVHLLHSCSASVS